MQIFRCDNKYGPIAEIHNETQENDYATSFPPFIEVAASVLPRYNGNKRYHRYASPRTFCPYN